MSELHFQPLHDEFGARVSGVDLTGELTGETVAAIRDSLDEYSLLCFPEQPMTDDAQLAITSCLGKPEPNHVKFGATGVVDYFGTVGNVIDAQTKKGNDTGDVSKSHFNPRFRCSCVRQNADLSSLFRTLASATTNHKRSSHR